MSQTYSKQHRLKLKSSRTFESKCKPLHNFKEAQHLGDQAIHTDDIGVVSFTHQAGSKELSRS